MVGSLPFLNVMNQVTPRTIRSSEHKNGVPLFTSQFHITLTHLPSIQQNTYKFKSNHSPRNTSRLTLPQFTLCDNALQKPILASPSGCVSLRTRVTLHRSNFRSIGAVRTAPSDRTDGAAKWAKVFLALLSEKDTTSYSFSSINILRLLLLLFLLLLLLLHVHY